MSDLINRLHAAALDLETGEGEYISASLLREAANDLQSANDIKENCKLVAHNTGDGWLLAVETAGTFGNTIAYLAWPATWPEGVTVQQIKSFGFEVV